jgi:hypothetical protein
MTISPDFLRLKLAESLAAATPVLTRRDVRLPGIPGKAFAVIGVRRGGKTSFLAQCRAERLINGSPPQAQLFLALEDERLAGMSVADLNWLLEEHARQFPDLTAKGPMTLYLDEAQLVPGWEGLVRRLMDRGGIELFVSGSSAKLLSREVATSLRGRAMEVLVHPFSFREALRHAGAEPARPYERLNPSERAVLDQRLRRYLVEGGFPEAQGAEPRDRGALLSGYVDVVVLRDVIERHAVSNPLALRWIERQLLANPGGAFSIKKHYDALRSQGVAVGKDTLHDYRGCVPRAHDRDGQRVGAPAHGEPAQGLSGGHRSDRSVRAQRPHAARARARDGRAAGAGAARLRRVLCAHTGWLRGGLPRTTRRRGGAARAGVPRERA